VSYWLFIVNALVVGALFLGSVYALALALQYVGIRSSNVSGDAFLIMAIFWIPPIIFLIRVASRLRSKAGKNPNNSL